MSPSKPDSGSGLTLAGPGTSSDIEQVALKPVSWLGGSLDEVRTFPPGARRQAGFQLDRVQRGLDPDDWKPMPRIGPGVREVRVRDEAGAFQVIYTANRPEAVYVLYAFQKKTRATAKHDLDLAAARLRELVRSGP